MTTSLSLYDASIDDLASLMAGQPAYRVKQVWQALYEQFRPVAEITTIPDRKSTTSELQSH